MDNSGANPDSGRACDVRGSSSDEANGSREYRSGQARNEREGNRTGQGSEDRDGGAFVAVPDADVSREVGENVEKLVPIEELVDRVVINTHSPMENLPPTTPPELKIIGRAVTFMGDTIIEGKIKRMRYEGLVGTINKISVMLINVRRYTDEDYEAYKLELERSEAKQTGSRERPGEYRSADGGFDTTYTGDSEAHGEAGQLRVEAPVARADSNVNNIADVSSVHPLLQVFADHGPFNPADGVEMSVAVNCQIDSSEKQTEPVRHVRNRLVNHTGSMGPIPFVTFSRHRIHDVQFGNDPPSTFYSLFREPSKKFFDMQCLRMFVRRYIVHSSQGKNPRNVPLRAFITCRCNCRELDNDLLIRVTREELGHILRIDREAALSHKMAEQRTRHNVGELIRTYQAPQGLFSHVGVLYLTRIPKQTFLLAILELGMCAVVFINLGVGTATAERGIVSSMVSRASLLIIMSGILTFMSSAATGLHSLRMRVPWSANPFIAGARLLLVSAAMAVCMATIIRTNVLFSAQSTREYLNSGIPNSFICNYYSAHRCSGFDEPCTEESTEDSLCQCSHLRPYIWSCKDIIMCCLERRFIFILCIGVVLMLVFTMDHYLHYRMYCVTRLVGQLTTGTTLPASPARRAST